MTTSVIEIIWIYGYCTIFIFFRKFHLAPLRPQYGALRTTTTRPDDAVISAWYYDATINQGDFR